MQRRSFLFRAGILAPAVVLAPSSVWASTPATQTNALFIAGNDNSDAIAGIVSNAGDQMQQLSATDIAEIRYARSGFSVRLKNGALYNSSKIILHSAFTIDIERLVVTVTTEEDDLSLQYNSGRNKEKPRPELWSYSTEKLGTKQMQLFLQRKKHAFMCVS